MASTRQSTEFATQTFTQWGEILNSAIETGLKFQEESSRFWTNLYNQGAETVRGRWQRVADELMPLNNKNTDRFQKLFHEQADRGMNLLRQAFDVCKVRTPAEWTDRAGEFWRASFDTMKEATEAATQVGAEAWQSWTDAVRTQTPHGRSSGKSAE